MPSGPSDAKLDALYQELILDHYRRPRNRGTVSPASGAAALRNPLCGDEITVTLALDPAAGTVADARFTGRGCSISQASASMMTQMAKGKRPAELEAVRERVRAMLRGEAGAAEDSAIGEMRALAGVARFPGRVKCALLAWDALHEALGAASRSEHASRHPRD